MKVLGTTALALMISGTALAVPDIGGTPIYTEEDYFSDGLNWGMDVYSYVYDHNSDLPSGYVLDPGEMLFAYLLDGDDAMGVSVDNFSVGNPFLANITSVGYESIIVPPGYVAGLREDPYLYGYSGPAQATVFTYAGDLFDPFSTLDPDEWSLVWYVAEATSYTFGPGTGTGAGIGDTQYVPIPVVPTPGVLALLSLAGFAGTRRRR